MTDLSRQRCHNHAGREAVARCPECGRYFCRECITEHEDRVLCTTCLEGVLTGSGRITVRLGRLVAGFALLSGLAMSWISFYVLGRLLLWVPESFHEGTLWRTGW